MKAMKHLTALLTLLVAVMVFAIPALAGERNERRITIVDEDGETYICKYTDDQMRIYNEETGEEVAVIDFDEIEQAVEKAMSSVEKALESAFDTLEDLELDLHFGDGENRFDLDLGDEDFTIDFDDLFESIGAAFEDMDFDGIHHGHRHSIRIDSDDDYDDMISEIEDLKDEIKKLKKELKSKSDDDF